MFALARAGAAPPRWPLALLLLLSWLAQSGAGGPLLLPRAQAEAAHVPLPHSVHRYELEAKLDPAQKRVTGRARITFTNTSERPLSELCFHLYMNAFRDEQSVFMKESGGFLRGLGVRGAGLIR